MICGAAAQQIASTKKDARQGRQSGKKRALTRTKTNLSAKETGKAGYGLLPLGCSVASTAHHKRFCLLRARLFWYRPRLRRVWCRTRPAIYHDGRIDHDGRITCGARPRIGNDDGPMQVQLV